MRFPRQVVAGCLGGSEGGALKEGKASFERALMFSEGQPTFNAEKKAGQRKKKARVKAGQQHVEETNNTR